MASDLLRLKAEDLDDLEVVSTCLQDALTRVADMTYLPVCAASPWSPPGSAGSVRTAPCARAASGSGPACTSTAC